MLRFAARLPDSLVRFAPDCRGALGLATRRWATTFGGAAGCAGCAAGSSRAAAPKTSFCRWSNAPFPIRTGRAPAYPVSSSRVDSVRSRRPSMPYMICSPPSLLGSRSAMNCMNSSASQSKFMKCRACKVNVESRIQV